MISDTDRQTFLLLDRGRDQVDGRVVAHARSASSVLVAPIKLGGLSEGGLLVQSRAKTWGRLIFQDLVKFD